jgi:hypothetical protein
MQVDSTAITKHTILAARITVYALAMVVWFQYQTFWAFAIPLLAMPLALVYGYVIGIALYYMKATVQVEEVEDLSVETIAEEVKFKNSEAVIGRVMDMDIHEYVDVQKPKSEEHIRCYFSRYVNLNREQLYTPEGWFFLNFLEPGSPHAILYLENPDPENSPAPTVPEVVESN